AYEILRCLVGSEMCIRDRAEPLRDWLADQRTGVGEQRRLTLPDGSLLTLNTDSAVDLAFDASQRLVRLLRGEIFVDSRADPRPFRVATAEARLHAGAARFNAVSYTHLRAHETSQD
ncbi:FecR domain-containing protein, partial [Pseudomonas aeruginosa]|uniref:FecR family protein n=1 Tax=Pseudomonas aeruginosa TaxID=287 RepID=UPI001CA56FCF